MSNDQFRDIATAVRTFVEENDRFYYTSEDRPAGLCQYPEPHSLSDCHGFDEDDTDDEADGAAYGDSAYPDHDHDQEYHKNFQLLKYLPEPTFLDEAIYEVIKRNITQTGFDAYFHPHNFYNYRYTSYRFDGRFITAQYFYDFGIGIVIQYGEELQANVPVPLPVPVPTSDMMMGNGYGNGHLEKASSGPRSIVYHWVLIDIFAGDGYTHGPAKWPGYATAREAEDAYYKGEWEAGRSIERPYPRCV